jgi:hypothetical protein
MSVGRLRPVALSGAIVAEFCEPDLRFAEPDLARPAGLGAARHEQREWRPTGGTVGAQLPRREEARPAGLGAARHEQREWRPTGGTVGAQLPRREEARPAGLEPASPGLEDRSRRLLKIMDFNGAVRLLVAALIATPLTSVESRGSGKQAPATVLLHSEHLETAFNRTAKEIPARRKLPSRRSTSHELGARCFRDVAPGCSGDYPRHVKWLCPGSAQSRPRDRQARRVLPGGGRIRHASHSRVRAGGRSPSVR